MKLVTVLTNKDAPREFRRFLENTGQDSWENKIAKIKRLPKFPPPNPNLYFHYIAAKNPLLHPIERYLSLEQSGKSVSRHLTNEMMKICGYLLVVNRIFHDASPTVTNKLKSTLLDDDTVKSFLFELDLAIHFLGLGHDVEFADLQGTGNYDLLVSDGEIQIEVECKTKIADAGRMIKKQHFYHLGDVLLGNLTPLTNKIAVFLSCKSQLSRDQQLYHEVAKDVKKCLQEKQTHGEIGDLEFSIVQLPNNLHVRNNAEAIAAVEPYWSPNSHYYIFSNGGTLIVGCQSADNNRVLKAIYRDLRRGSEQLSKTRPSLLACYLAEIEDESWDQLKGASGLTFMTNRLLGNPQRGHINYMVYSSDRTPPKHTGPFTRFSATNCWFENPNPTFPITMSFFGEIKRD